MFNATARLYIAIAMLATPRKRHEEGAAMVEYGLLIAFIAVVALVGVKLLGGSINTFFSGISFT